MFSERERGWHYVAPADDAFWEWDASDFAVRWRTGSLIAFKEEIVPVLRRLAPHGLPIFDSVVLFLAACRQHGSIGADELVRNNVLPSSDKPGERGDGSNEELYSRLAYVLKIIADVPFHLRDSVEEKAILAEKVFEGVGMTGATPDVARIVLRFLEAGPTPEDCLFGPSAGLFDPVARITPLLGCAVGSIIVEQLKLRRQTGLDDVPEPVPVKEAPARSLHSLLAELEEDEELCGAARLTRRLAAALTIPRAVSEPNDIALGGVSDISNRGPLDRLLVSELAQDDLTFTVRVALSEALYLRREAPPVTPPRRRRILIDSGFRMWGVPRVYATAAGLALALSSERSFEVSLYRPSGPEPVPIDITTREGLVQHLAALEIDIHPGESLPDFFRSAREEADDCEIVLITGDDVLADPAFRVALKEHAPELLYVVSVDRRGKVCLNRRTTQGATLLRELRCSLDEVLKPSPGAASLVDAKVDPSLPVILRLSEFPLRLPHPVNAKAVWNTGYDGVLAKTSDGRLMHWDLAARGARQRTDRLAHGRLLWHSLQLGGDRSIAVVGRLSQNGASLVHIPLPSGPCQTFPLAFGGPGARGVAGHSGAIFAIFSDHVESFSERDGSPISRLVVAKHHRWERDRFFRHGDGFCALAFNGTSVEFVQVCSIRDSRGAWPLAIVEVPGMEGPFVLNFRGHVYRLNDGAAVLEDEPLMALPFAPAGYTVRSIAADSTRVVMSANGRKKDEPDLGYLLNLTDQKYHTVSCSDADGVVNRHLTQRISAVTLRNRFSHIGYDGETLALVAGKGVYCRITWDDARREVQLESVRTAPFSAPIPFSTEVDVPTGYRLRCATWNDGSRAYLDSRGLLHLVSADKAIPEMTFVLYEGAMAGWCADGGTWGMKYFEVEPGTITPERVFHDVLKRFVRRLR